MQFRASAVALALVAGLSGAVVSTAFAETQAMSEQERRDVLERLDRKVAAGRFDEAHALALEHRFDLEGQSLFDFYYGLAALETGNTSEAVFALDRAVAQRPGFTRARLELARAHFEVGDDRRAREHFRQVLAQEPPPPVAARVEQYLHAMDRRADRYSTVVSGWIEGGLGHDTNVNSATDADEITVNLFGIDLVSDLDDGQQELDDEFWRTAVRGRISEPLARGVTVFAQADFEERQNLDEGDFDTRRLGGRFGTVFHGDRARTEVGFGMQRFWLDGDAYQDRVGLFANSRYSLGTRTALLGSLQWSRLGYDELGSRDSDLLFASGGVSHAWQAALRPVTSLSLFLGDESARDDGDVADSQASRDIYGVGAQLGLTLAPAWRFTTALQYRRSEYGADNPLFGETREDDYYQLDLDLHWQPNPRWRIGPHVRLAENDSNIDLYEYDREVYELRVRYNF